MMMGLVLLASVALCGCNTAKKEATGQVSGKVTLQGKPVTVGIVQFYNSQAGSGASAELDETGSYKLATPIKVGDYQVAVQPPKAPSPMEMNKGAKAKASPVPVKFHHATSSGLKTTVKEGQNQADFTL
jgi:hypothetical protein